MNLKLTYPIWVKVILWMMAFFAFGGIYYSLFQNDGDYIFPIVGITLIIIAGVIDSHASKTWITDNEVFYESFLQKKRISIPNIDSFEINENGIKLYAIEGKPKSITISNYLRGYDFALVWAKKSITRRDEDIYKAEFIDSMTSDTFGNSVKGRFARIERIKKQVKWLNILTWTTPIAHLIFQQIRFVTLPIILILPLVITGFIMYYKGAVKIYDTEKSHTYFYPNILTALAISCIISGLSALFKYDIYSWNNHWINIIVVSILLCVLVLYYAPLSIETKVSSKIGTVLFLLIFYSSYSCGLLLGINCNYNTSEPKQYEVIIADKYVTKGKTKSHNLKLKEWGPLNKSTTLGNLKADYYDSVSKGDTILITYRNGLLDIAWYQAY